MLIVQLEDNSSLPPLFGNFDRVRATLTNIHRKEEFNFAIVGDTRSKGVFERIVEELRKTPLDFVVILGDASKGSEHEHRYFRAEVSNEYALPFPVFYIVGNHDVEYIPISRFEELYGPSIFSFENQDCLFIALGIIGDPSLDRESIDFLKSLTDEVAKYRNVFVFMHIPPPIPTFESRKFHGPKELISLFKQMNVDYVFTGHYHGYTQTQYEDTTYIVSGGGGARLDERKFRQFHHAVLIRVGKDYVAERIIQIPRGNDIEDILEKFAITKAYPWLYQNRLIICGFNIILLITLIWGFRSFYENMHISERKKL